MGKLQKLIDNKAQSAKFMCDEIAHICNDMPKRDPAVRAKNGVRIYGGLPQTRLRLRKVHQSEYKLNPSTCILFLCYFGKIIVSRCNKKAR